VESFRGLTIMNIYEAPDLIEYGTIEEITRTDFVNDFDDKEINCSYWS
jgi:hypothetical protein